ncbi:YdjY domain-containing protein [Phycisphaera mikurensis]|uniref:Uncharacterized protein n=1 Tax=Phycisphaera mikurensis (strain NBRC 102666 / KCTC 22515 / FYK2301M01) TaxID=1142394 RepID=I0IFS0_PHYMF|nr:YdjY domain-containing protein [Phycisphaera mikurensis]MBB6440502.1 hypothetical protein [Phycisphaera mikurensis]BAM04108.1 hypothetical protein PSMK_19490 [Phycisphaera mikurensis NBRC 102666]
MAARGPWTKSARNRPGPRRGLGALALCLAAGVAAQDVPPAASLPHVRVDREAGIVEFAAEVIGREADWLELLVCSAGGREHESLLRTEAAPSHVHLGLVMIGLEPGRPAGVGPGGAAISPAGPGLRVTLHSPDGAFPAAEAGGWLLDRTAGRTLARAGWRFTGSRVLEDAAGPAYLADVNGTLLSLVSFGDDLVLLDLAAERALNAGNDGQRFAASSAVPGAGTAVLVRLGAAGGGPAGGAAVDTGPDRPDTPGPSPENAPDPPQDAE